MPGKYWQRRIRWVTYACPRCGRPFLTEALRDVHYLSCGA